MEKLIICDWNRTLFRPETGKLYADSLVFLDIFCEEKLFLISQAEACIPADKKLIRKYFKKVYIGPKELSLFSDIKKQYRNKECWVVGDKIDSEIFLGNLSGYKTIRVKRGRFRRQQPKCVQEKAGYEVGSLKAAAKIILSK